jgi:NAD(P)-dependent dehydrogenase (short-subunit alcohol dehydrogenase family)
MTDRKKVAIVTGASRGLGAVIAKVLASRGYDLVLGGRDRAALGRVAASLTGRVRVSTVAGDVGSPHVRAEMLDAAQRLGELHVLVNNASELGGIAPLAEADPAVFTRVLDRNLAAPVALVQLAVGHFRAGRALVVNISSDAAKGAYPGWGVYGSSKAALELASLTLASELRDRGIAFVIVDPGDMRTRMHQEAFAGEDISDRPLPEVTVPFWEWLFDQNPMDVTGQRFAAQQAVVAGTTEDDHRWQPV